MRKAVIVCLLSVCASVSHSQNHRQWLSYASISPDGKSIAFSFHENIYGALNRRNCQAPDQRQRDSALAGLEPGVKTLGGSIMENQQTKFDIQIMNDYESVGGGRDKQLEAAIKEMEQELLNTK